MRPNTKVNHQLLRLSAHHSRAGRTRRAVIGLHCKFTFEFSLIAVGRKTTVLRTTTTTMTTDALEPGFSSVSHQFLATLVGRIHTIQEAEY